MITSEFLQNNYPQLEIQKIDEHNIAFFCQADHGIKNCFVFGETIESSQDTDQQEPKIRPQSTIKSCLSCQRSTL